MKKCWENILNNNEIVISEEIMHNKSTLINAFETSIQHSNYEFVKWTHTKSAPFQCIIKSGNTFVDVLIYLKNISNAGWDDKPHIKRVQVSNPKVINLEFSRFDDMKKISFIIGYYNYEKPIFVSWDASEFRRHKTNRSCYVDVESLQNGYIEGFYKTNFFGQDITLFTPENINMFLEDYFNHIAVELNEIADKLYDITVDYYKMIDTFDKYWDGKDKVIEMRDANFNNWKQNEWQGFYFEYLMEKVFGERKFTKITFENTKFDLFEYIPWDLKVHTLNSSSKHKVITNDIQAIREAINTFGYQGFIILEGSAEFEQDGEFRLWHNEIKGGLSKYQIQNEALGKQHRRRKSAFKLSKLLVLVLTQDDLSDPSVFQGGFVNSNGKTRKPKLIIELDKIDPQNIILEKEL